MINAASSRLPETNHVIESKNTSFTVTRLALKIKKCPARLQMGKKWLDINDVYVNTNAPASQSKAATLFSLFEPSGFFTLQLNLSWRHSRSSLAWPLFFQLYVHCKLDLLLARTARQSDRHRRARGLAGYSRWGSTEQCRSWNCGAPSASAQRSTGSFTCEWEKENVKKAQCWEKMKKSKAVASLARLSMKESANSDVSGIAERTWKDRDLMFFYRRFVVAQNKPVVSSRYHNKELKRDRK